MSSGWEMERVKREEDAWQARIAEVVSSRSWESVMRIVLVGVVLEGGQDMVDMVDERAISAKDTALNWDAHSMVEDNGGRRCRGDVGLAIEEVHVVGTDGTLDVSLTGVQEGLQIVAEVQPADEDSSCRRSRLEELEICRILSEA